MIEGICIQRDKVTFAETGESVWERSFRKLDKYIKFAAWDVAKQYYNSIHHIYGYDDMYQDGLMLLFKLSEQYKDKPEEEFDTLFKSSLWRLLRSKASKLANPKVRLSDNTWQSVTLENADDQEETLSITQTKDYSDEVIEDIFMTEQLSQVYELLKEAPIAVSILNEFLQPSFKTMLEANMDLERKRTQQMLGKRVCIPSTLTVNNKHVKASLGLTDRTYNKYSKLLKQALIKVYNIADYQRVVPELAAI